MKQKISRLVDRLSRLPATPNSFNPYALGNPHNAIRRQNVQLYFSEIAQSKPTILLLGEAPGYQGSRLTGVPFCSEDILLSGVTALGMFGQHKGYRKTTEYEKVHKEPSATIVWSTLANFSFRPLIWSSFPFHPHQPGKPRSNRAPSRTEVELGRAVFQELVDIFGIKRIVAVGNVAHQSLADSGIVADKIRHPSHGGKNEFVSGIAKLVKKH
jgi:uracil-DNA glycosylase